MKTHIDKKIDRLQKEISELLLKKQAQDKDTNRIEDFLLSIGYVAGNSSQTYDTFVKNYHNSYSCEIMFNSYSNDNFASFIFKRGDYYIMPVLNLDINKIKEFVEEIDNIDFENPYKISINFELSGVSPKDIHRNLVMMLSRMTEEEINEKFKR